MPQRGAVTDTGSMAPSAEALAWAQRADAWAQQPAAEPDGQLARRWEPPASRWSEVAPTGNPAFPAEGVGWRTETAEWRAAEQTARWRQTTEWRSATGTHGWRSTTEAWQTGSGAEDFLPPTDPSTRQQLAISGTAWPTPQNGDQPGGPPSEAPPSWQQGSERTTQSEAAPWQQPSSTPAWQQPGSTPAWQEPADGPPAWQQFAGPPPAPWERAAPAGPAPREATARPTEPTLPWQPLVDPTQSGQLPVDPRPSWERRGDSRAAPVTGPVPYGGAWSGTVDDGRHLVRDDDRARWRRESAAGMGAVDPRSAGRRRAPEAGGSRHTSGGTGWSGRSDADNWAGHTDTGGMPLLQPPSVPDAPTWGARAEAPGRRGDSDVGTWSDRVDTPDHRRESDRPSWQSEPIDRDAVTRGWGRGGSPGTDGVSRSDRRPPEIDVPSWRRGADQPREIESGSWQGAGGSRRPEPEIPSWQRDRVVRAENDAPSWQSRAESDLPSRPRYDESRSPGAELPQWRRDIAPPLEIEPPGRRRDQVDGEVPSWRRDEAATDWRDRSDSRRAESDSGAWSRGDEPRTDGWRRPADPDPDNDGPSWRDDGLETGSWRREPDPATDPWAPSATDTGVIPTTWNQPVGDTDSWRQAPEDGRRPHDGGRRWVDEEPGIVGRRRPVRGAGRSEPVENGSRAEAPIDPAVWRGESQPRRGGANWPADGPDDDIEPDDPPGYRTPGDKAHPDWHRELREEVRRENPGDAATQIRRIDPAAWQAEERDQAARGSAVYREGNTGDWRRDLAAESGPADDGEARRFGAQDFVPFRPVGSASVPAPPAGAPPLNYSAPGGPRQELLIGSDRPAARWQDPPDTQWPPRGAANGYQGGTAGGSYERRSVSSLPGSSGRQSNLLEPDDDEIEESTGGPLAAVGYTVIWYGVPVVLFVLYMLVLNGAQQAHALSTLAGAAPQFGLSLVLSMLVAVGLRWASGSWKAASVGLAAAVMGGGLATVLTSAITGNALN